MTVRKIKVSITLSSALLERIDRRAARKGATRSMLIERWLRLAARHEAEAELDDATARYYEGLTPEEAAEEKALSRSITASAKRLSIDAPPDRAGKRGQAR